MRRTFFRAVLFTLSCLALTSWPTLLVAQSAYGVTSSGALVRFDIATPGTLTMAKQITGLGIGETILGIDFRPATGELYGLGSASKLYIINPNTAVATQVGPNGAFALSGTAFGFDFDPALDQIRVVSDNGQNIRVRSNGTLAANDGTLTWAPPETASPPPSVVAIAFNNNAPPSSTPGAPFFIDSARDALGIINNGQLYRVGLMFQNVSSVAGFDIYTNAAGQMTLLAVLNIAGTSGLYRIDSGTAQLFPLGNFLAGMTMTGFAVAPKEPRLGNISTRALVQTGNNVMIAGFVIEGTGPQTLAVVATGPSLAQFGISNPLPNPKLTLVRSSDQAVMASNDNWQAAANASELQAAGFAPSNPLEAAILISLLPGAYTAIVEDAASATGVAVVGVYRTP